MGAAVKLLRSACHPLKGHVGRRCARQGLHLRLLCLTTDASATGLRLRMWLRCCLLRRSEGRVAYMYQQPRMVPAANAEREPQHPFYASLPTAPWRCFGTAVTAAPLPSTDMTSPLPSLPARAAKQMPSPC